MKIFVLFIVACFCHGGLAAQDSARLTGTAFDSSSFADDDTLTRSDYLLQFGQAFQALNKASVIEKYLPSIESIGGHVTRDDSALAIIRNHLLVSDNVPDIRSLQMYIVLLDQLKTENKEFTAKVNGYDRELDSTKRVIFLLKEDSAILAVFQSATLRHTFASQVSQFRAKWKYADSTIKRVNILVDETLAHLTNNDLLIDELERKADALVQTMGPRIFSKERRYIWEPRTPTAHQGQYSLSKNLSQEKAITVLYFQHTSNRIYLLLLTGLFFFWWVSYNFKSLSRSNKTKALSRLPITYLKPLPVLVSLTFIFNLAPLFDLDAPPVYIETVEFLLVFTLTALFFKQLSRRQAFVCFAFIALFVLLSITRLIGLPFYLQRWWMLCISGTSFILGLYELSFLKKDFKQYKALIVLGIVFILFQFGAVVTNIFGRVTLTKILGTSAFTGFIQALGLIVFVQLIKEAFLLQIQASRMRKQYNEEFEFQPIVKGIVRPLFFLAALTWLVGFTTSLNLFDALNDHVREFLGTSRTLGNISFTYSGILLFLAIIWTANFLQKYVTYFFGDTGDDASFDNKGQRSRLLITRLVLLIAGFMLAVAASGLPLDKITVILGALGIGIGLGLQNIVNNFVSGIILIFDRPVRIGDTVEIGGRKGRVKEISVRASTLLTADGAEVIIPNGDILAHNIVNWTLSNNHIRVEVYVMIERPTIDDGTKAALEQLIHDMPEVLQQRPPEILVYPINAQSAKIKIFFWCKDVSQAEQLRSLVYSSVYNYLKSHNSHPLEQHAGTEGK